MSVLLEVEDATLTVECYNPNPVELCIVRGLTFKALYQWGQPTKTYKQITAATVAAPCVISAASHGVPDGWRFRVEGAEGMVELNNPVLAEGETPTEYPEFWIAKVLTAGTIEINELNAAVLDAYTGGGILVYDTPVDLAGATADFIVTATREDTESLLTIAATLDNTAKRITVEHEWEDTAEIEFDSGYYRVIATDTAGDKFLLAHGPLKVR